MKLTKAREIIAQEIEVACKPCDRIQYNCCASWCEHECCGTEHELVCSHAAIAAAVRAGAK